MADSSHHTVVVVSGARLVHPVTNNRSLSLPLFAAGGVEAPRDRPAIAHHRALPGTKKSLATMVDYLRWGTLGPLRFLAIAVLLLVVASCQKQRSATDIAKLFAERDTSEK
jgi:hypothetical protein